MSNVRNRSSCSVGKSTAIGVATRNTTGGLIAPVTLFDISFSNRLDEEGEVDSSKLARS